MTRPKLLAAGLAAVALAGCGSNDNASDNAPSKAANPSNTPAQTTENQSAPGGTAAGGATEVRMAGIAFKPRNITAKVGGTVKWTNDDNVPHNVVATSGASFQSPTFGKGGTYEFKLRRAG